jgi:hypothetical protein
MKPLFYSSGYKYQIRKNHHFQTNIRGFEANTQFIKLSKEGLLSILNGYACDGPSGPTIDTPIFLYAAFIHDALYQLIRMGHLPFPFWRNADYELKRAVALKLNDMRDHTSWGRKIKSQSHEVLWQARLLWIMKGLAIVKGEAAKPSKRKKVQTL